MKFKPYPIIIICSLILIGIIILFVIRPFQRPHLLVCTRLPPVKIRGREPAFTPNYKLQWAKEGALRVWFEEGKTPLTDSVLKVANIWSKYCGMSFIRADKEIHSDLRITFKSGGLASAIGRECQQPEYAGTFTTFLEGIDTVRDPIVFRRIILHEFGHALGLEHELNNPNAQIHWDKKEVYKFYDEKYGWDEKTVDANVFKILAPGNKPYNEFDRTSIMVYAIQPPLSKETIPWPKGLSRSDTIGIATWYPKPLKP